MSIEQLRDDLSEALRGARRVAETLDMAVTPESRAILYEIADRFDAYLSVLVPLIESAVTWHDVYDDGDRLGSVEEAEMGLWKAVKRWKEL